MKILLILFASMTVNLAYAEMYKCVGKDKKAVYQQTKCPSDTNSGTVKAADKVNPIEALKSEFRKQDAEFYLKIKTAISNHEVILGMSKSDVTQSLGNPTKVNLVGNEQWVYRSEKSSVPSKYVYFDEHGIVKATN